ncbi:type I methionyl aminopeptidase [candidate division WS5 bacterium]|uniref:Methionine aminopeptidase n=1 Tax=candidate division WS5 bacterium TaxID=2093353 RepID=A0A419DEA5_9BACT|nr:MAG: type I methionyl aminopeptidase [candidate division WS5 bacterium]
MISIKTPREIDAMREGGRILAAILYDAKEFTCPGITTKDIDRHVGRLCLKYKVKPAFKGYQDFPANICTSINDEIVHGLPSDRVIKEGDLVSLDFGVLYKGFNTDSAITFGVGKISPVKKKIAEVAQKSFFAGAKEVKAGAYLGDYSAVTQKYIEDRGFSVVRCLAGHGIGREVHEEPSIPNFGRKKTGIILEEGMTLALEPMVTEKGFELQVASDKWTYATVDGGLSSHFEHTIVVTKKGYEILTK